MQRVYVECSGLHSMHTPHAVHRALAVDVSLVFCTRLVLGCSQRKKEKKEHLVKIPKEEGGLHTSDGTEGTCT